MTPAWIKSLCAILRDFHSAGALLACTLLMLFVIPGPARAGSTLRIATWDVSQAEKSIFTRKKNEKRSSWRHTFGSERHDLKKSRLGVFNLDVDVVLLQGVRNVSALKRVFPTRHWKLIVSRDYMRKVPPLSRLPMDLQGFDIAAFEHRSDQPVTAIAVRYQRRLRVRGIKHVKPKEFHDPSDNKLDEAPSATAVRINHFGVNVWLVSLATATSCQEPVANCAPVLAIKKWYSDSADRVQFPAITGFSEVQRAIDNVEDAKTPHCGKLWSLTQSCDKDRCLGKRRTLTRPKLGCIVLTTVHLRRPRPPQRALLPPDF